MNKGRIEQAGSPKEVFEKPATEFVARFLGGHNVIGTPGGPIAVRADRLKLLSNGAGANRTRLNATIRGIEYQGTHYQVALDNGENSELTATVSDEAFAATPLSIGDNVAVQWADEDVHALSPAP